MDEPIAVIRTITEIAYYATKKPKILKSFNMPIKGKGFTKKKKKTFEEAICTGQVEL